jgi:inner membrane protein
MCAPPTQRRRGLLYGAALGTLPDLDVLLPAADVVSSMVTHRGFSHSLLVLTVLAPLLHALLAKFDRTLDDAQHRWRLAFWLALITHPLLDWCTTYGTQLLWPLDRTPYALGSIFIIDPVYTLPLLLATLVVGFSTQLERQRRWLRGALWVSSGYLLWCLLAQSWVHSRTQPLLASLNLPADTPVHVSPAPLNSLLWRIVVIDPDGGWYEGWFSLLSESTPQALQQHAGLRAPTTIDLPPLRRLAAFSHGWYALREEADTLWYADLRMGAQPWLAFRFALAQRDTFGHWQALDPVLQAAMGRPPLHVLGWVLRRIFDPTVALPSLMGSGESQWLPRP